MNDTPTLLLTNLVLRLNRAENVMLSQVFDDHPASPAECMRVHDRLLGQWSLCNAASCLFSESEQAKFKSLNERTTFICQNLRSVR